MIDANTVLEPEPRPSARNFVQDLRPSMVEVLDAAQVVFDLSHVEVFYGAFRAVRDVTMRIHKNQITAFIGPSGCGKTTVLRSLNRMHDVTPGARVAGRLQYHGVELYAPNVSATEV